MAAGLLLSGLVTWGLAVGCGTPPPTAQGSTQESAEVAFRVEYAGCGGARRGPICLLPEKRKLTLWLSHPSAEVEASLDGQPLALPEGARVQGGVRLEIEVTPENRQLRLEHRARQDAGSQPWSLRFEPQPSPEWRARAFEHLREGDLDQARREIEDALAQDLPDAQRGEALALFGQLLRQRGETARGQDLIRNSLPLLQRGGDLQQAFNQTTALVYFLTAQDHRFTEARERLEALPRNWQSPGEVDYYDGYYQGLLAASTGNLRGALSHLERAAEIAQRTGTAAYLRAAEELIAVQLQRLGRRQEAASSLESLLEQARAAGDSCRQAGLLGNLGWNALLSEEAQAPQQDPIPFLEEALALFQGECPKSLTQRHNALLNIALARLHDGDLEATRGALEKADGIPRGSSLRLLLWRREIDARIALAEQRPREAIRLYGELETLASAALVPEAAWRARVGLATARWESGDLSRALEDFETSEALLEGELFQVPLQEGRESFLAQRQASARRHLELLLQLDRPLDAFALARRGRVRLLRSYHRTLRLQGLSNDQRVRWESFVADYQAERAAIDELAGQDWQLAADALVELQDKRQETRKGLARKLDEVMSLLEPGWLGEGRRRVALSPLRLTPSSLALLFHRRGNDRENGREKDWVVFAHQAGEIDISTPTCPSLDDTSLATCLLAPQEDRIRSASELHILATGRLKEVDFHGLSIGDTLLLDLAPVIYDLDLGSLESNPRHQQGDSDLDSAMNATTEFSVPAPRTSAPTSTLASALILADPTGDLPEARREAEIVTALLSKSAQTHSLTGQETTSDALAKALRKPDLFHFAGHATFAGRGGWQSFLPLAANNRFTLEDVLLLEDAPRWVVLSGCDTARTDANRSVAESLGLAQAFLVAGSEGVLAAVRPVDDRLASELVQEFYQYWVAGSRPSEALRSAQLALRSNNPSSDWSSFRWIVR
ncbi:MAG: CHAT domain-containing protein [Deltaproteobacteria bacterium]|nr:CHAT domain-containing protein [Deltaproteobacteria bacterium]